MRSDSASKLERSLLRFSQKGHPTIFAISIILGFANDSLLAQPMSTAEKIAASRVSVPRETADHIFAVQLGTRVSHVAVIDLGTAEDVSYLTQRGMLPSEALWYPARPHMTFQLPDTEGTRFLRIGTRLDIGEEVWQVRPVTVDKSPPELAEFPKRAQVSNSTVLPIKGSVNDHLSTLHVKAVNGTNILADRPGWVAGRTYSPNNIPPNSTRPPPFKPKIFRPTASAFSAGHIRLMPGTNTLTLTLRDVAGNASEYTLHYLLDNQPDHVPPAMDIHWPNQNEEISADTLRVRGRVDDPDTRIWVTDEAGEKYSGAVGMNGLFGIPSIRLLPEGNRLRVTAVDRFNNQTVKELFVIRSPVDISIDPIHLGGRVLNGPLNVTGTISDPLGYDVWVNGVKAAINGTRWSARNVPLNSDGASIVQARALRKGTPLHVAPQFHRRTLEDLGNPTPRR